MKFSVSTPWCDRIHYVNEQDVRVLLGRLPHTLWSRLRAVHFNDRARGNRRLGYVTTRGRREITLCALPPRIGLTRFLVKRQTPEKFGARRGHKWPVLAVRRFMLYDVFLHELGHMQLINERAPSARRKICPMRRWLSRSRWNGATGSGRIPSNTRIQCTTLPLRMRLRWRSNATTLRSITTSATRWMNKSDSDAAIVEYRKALELRPDDATANNNLGNALADKGDLDAAIVEYRKALELEPEHVVAHYNLGIALKDKGDLDAAIVEYRKALELKPDYVKAHNNLGIALKDKGDLDAAIVEYRKALELKPDHVGAHNNLGAALADKGDLDAAIVEYRKALELKPEHVGAHYNLGIALKDKGDLDAAIVEYRKALELKPDYVGAHNNLGVALADKGDLDAAIVEYRKALELEPDDAIAHENLMDALNHKGH